MYDGDYDRLINMGRLVCESPQHKTRNNPISKSKIIVFIGIILVK